MNKDLQNNIKLYAQYKEYITNAENTLKPYKEKLQQLEQTIINQSNNNQFVKKQFDNNKCIDLPNGHSIKVYNYKNKDSLTQKYLLKKLNEIYNDENQAKNILNYILEGRNTKLCPKIIYK